MFRQIGILCFLSVFLCMAAPAAAFLPDDEVLQEELDKQYGALSSWEAEMTFPDFPGVAVHLWYARGKWRQQWTPENALAVGRGFSTVALCTRGEFAKSPMFLWMVPNAVTSWRSWGVAADKRSFGFCDGSPCILFGAGPGDETSPAVRLNNEDLSPILIRYMADGILTSVQYGDYRTYGGFRVPQSVRVTIGAEYILDARVKWLGANRADGEELYVREAVDTPCEAPPAPFDILRDAFKYPRAR